MQAQQPNSPNVQYLSGNPDGDIRLSIDGKIYEYEFGSKQTYESYVKSYWRNKGRFLIKIKPFQKKDEN